MKNRYERRLGDAAANGQALVLAKFEAHVANSCACKGMPRWELERLASSDTATAATYYQQISGNSRIPDDNRWDRLRRIADASFFESFGEQVHFAALSTEGCWLTNYGDGAIFFKENMISHRVTVFEENTATWVDDNNGSLVIPYGYRSNWEKRGMLAVAKLGDRVASHGTSFAALLLSCGLTSGDDSFMEVHIVGGFTIRSVASMVVRQNALSLLGRQSIVDRLQKIGISLTELP